MKRLAVLIAVALLMVGGVGSARAVDATRFFSVIEDLPLMPGLNENEGRSIAFDSPQGRIVEAYAAGAVSEQDVRHFYAAVLPQLGWRVAGPDAFNRERETLKMDFSRDTNAPTLLIVHFSLAPVVE